MSDIVLYAVITAIPPTMASIVAIFQNKKILVKTDEIHSLTNSNLTDVKAALVDAQSKIEKLEQILEAFQRENT